MIGLADNRFHKRSGEVDGRFLYYELRLRLLTVRIRSDVPLCSSADAVMMTREAVGDVLQDPSPGGVVVSVLTVAGDD